MRWIALYVLLLPTLLYAQTPDITFTVSADTVYAGDEVELRWEVTGAAGLFLFPTGSVAERGTIRVSPDGATTYTLLAEGPDGIATKSVTVKVEGTRGFDLPRLEDFDAERSYEIAGKPLTQVLKSIHYVLQDTLRFVKIHAYRDLAGASVFITNTSVKPYLVADDERRIAARRISYAVVVDPPKETSDALSYTIGALIEYRRRSENKWRDEHNEDLYHRELDRLERMIRQAAGP